MPRNYPTIYPGLLLPEYADALNEALADIGTLQTGIRTTAPLYCIQDGGGVVIGLDLVAETSGNLTIPVFPAEPSLAGPGSIFFNSTSNTLEVFSGGVWVYSALVVAITMPTSPVIGTLWLNSGVLQYWSGSAWVTVCACAVAGSAVQTITVGTPGTTVANTMVTTTIFGNAIFGTTTLAANYFTVAGKSIRIKMNGVFSKLIADTLVITIKDIANGILFATSSVLGAGTAVSGVGWSLEATIIYDGAGVVNCEGSFLTEAGTGVFGRVSGSVSPSALSETIDILATWNATSPSDTITCNSATIEALN